MDPFLVHLGPFHNIDPVATSGSLEELYYNEPETERTMHITPIVNRDDGESEYEDGNIFNFIDI